jgi:hypothetical protein
MKVIFPNGNEIVQEIVDALFTPGEGEFKPDFEFMELGCKARTHISEGTIYVMNENGKTIANYILGEHKKG